jgi:hypothetical protein
MTGLPAVAHPSLSSDLPAAKPGRPRRHDDRPTFSSVQGITTRLPRRRRTLALRRLAGAPGLTAATTEPDVSNTLCTPTMAIAVDLSLIFANVRASAESRRSLRVCRLRWRPLTCAILVTGLTLPRPMVPERARPRAFPLPKTGRPHGAGAEGPGLDPRAVSRSASSRIGFDRPRSEMRTSDVKKLRWTGPRACAIGSKLSPGASGATGRRGHVRGTE